MTHPLPLFGYVAVGGGLPFMRKSKGFHCPMAAKGLSSFFQKDKVVRKLILPVLVAEIN